MILPEQFDFTQGNLQDYVDCPYRFYLRHIRHTKWPALIVEAAHEFEERTRAGARFHRMVQQYLSGVPESQIADFALADPLPDIAIWWDRFVNFIPPWLEGQHLVETLLSTHHAGHRLIAKYDLLLVTDQNRFIIFDWKTSSRKPRKELILGKIQTRLYRFILTQAGSIFIPEGIKASQVTMNYWYASVPDTPISLPYDHEAYEKDVAYFTQIIGEIQGNEENDFSKTADTRKCRYCVYRSHCDRGVQAGDLEAFVDFPLDDGQDNLDIDFDNISEIEF